ncbi:hypothetical protein ACSAZL_01085 [Methanosarcina sp. T3]
MENKTNSVSSAFQQNGIVEDPDACYRPMLSRYYSTRPDQNCVSDEGRDA